VIKKVIQYDHNCELMSKVKSWKRKLAKKCHKFQTHFHKYVKVQGLVNFNILKWISILRVEIWNLWEKVLNNKHYWNETLDIINEFIFFIWRFYNKLWLKEWSWIKLVVWLLIIEQYLQGMVIHLCVTT